MQTSRTNPKKKPNRVAAARIKNGKIQVILENTKIILNNVKIKPKN